MHLLWAIANLMFDPHSYDYYHRYHSYLTGVST